MTTTFKTGPSGGIKATAINAAKATMDKYNEDKIAIQKEITELPPGTIVFSTMGDPVFNCRADGGFRIRFKAGKYIVYPDTKNRDAILKTLEYQLEQGRLTSETTKA